MRRVGWRNGTVGCPGCGGPAWHWPDASPGTPAGPWGDTRLAVLQPDSRPVVWRHGANAGLMEAPFWADEDPPPSPHRVLCNLCCDYLHEQIDINWAHGVVVSHPLRMRKALGSNPSVSMHMCMHGNSLTSGISVFLFMLLRFWRQKVVL